MHPFEMLEQLLIIFAHGVLDHGGTAQTFPPVALHLALVEVGGSQLDLILAQVLLSILEFFLLDGSFAGDEF